LDEEQAGGPSSRKKTWVTSLRRLGNSKVEVDEWRQCICDALEIANAERHAFWMQLEVIWEVLDIANIEHHSIRVQLEGIHQAIKYFAGVTWETYMGGLTWG